MGPSQHRSRWFGRRSGGGPARHFALLFAPLIAMAGLLGTIVPVPSAAAAITATWRGEYFTGTALAGAPVLVRDDAAIAFDWEGSPAPGLPADNFSVRWTRTIGVATAGTYRLSTVTDDGVRLYVDGVLRIDKWFNQGSTQYVSDLALTAGEHTVVMEYFEATGWATAKLSVQRIDPTAASGTWRGEYFDNPSLSGQPVMVRNDAGIDFDWGGGGPAPEFQGDFFSVRWSQTLTLDAGRWVFTTYTDDGARLRVDGVTVINQWVAQSPTTHRAEVDLSAGSHQVVLEYFENQGGAQAELTFARLGAGSEVRIDAGGNGFVDRRGDVWSADQSFTGGAATSVGQPIHNTFDDGLYTTERAGDFSYRVPVANGTWKLRLHFAELIQNSSGVRQFDVTAEGQPILTRFDIHAAAGKASLITSTFDVAVADGFLDLAFANVFDNAVLQAFDLHPAGTTRDLARPVFQAIPEPQNASHSTPPTVTVGVTDNLGLKDGYWRIDDGAAQPLFSNPGTTTWSGQFTPPVDVFNALPLGPHVLSFGANDNAGNAWVTRWAFRKLDSGSASDPIAFDRRVLASAQTPGATAMDQPTSIAFGPDGRLYVAQQDGYIHALTLDANRNVAAVQRIDTIRNTPNTNADGSPASGVVGRHLMGIDFDPASTVERPILWAAHSDPRFCFGETPATCPTNTSSGTITRLVGPSFDAAANRKDYVTGLPRSRELHAPNAVHFGPDGWLYLTIGSNTNYGAASTAFSELPEVWLTATMIRMNVNGAASSFPIDARSITSSATERPGVLETYATGYRNAFDFLFHSNGTLYLNGNAGNLSSGNTPGPGDGCANGVSFDPGNRNDYLAIVERGDHGGHPNPTRGQCVLDDGSMYAPPKSPDAKYRDPILNYSNGTSSDGMVEYTAPTFGGQMLGNIISATFAGNQSVRRVVLAADGRSAVFEEDLGTFNQPLDVAVGSDGSIYVAEHGGDDIVLLEPRPRLTGSWSARPELPVPTQEIGAVACAGRMYVMGGLVAPNTDTNDLWAFDPSTDLWSQRADFPGSGVDHPGAACVNGRVYLIGGLVNAGTPSALVHEYDPATNAWTRKADMPRGRGAMGIAAVAGRIYAAGGLAAGAGSVTDMAVFDPVANTWQVLPSMPTPRDHLIMEAIDGRLYAIGGRTNDFNAVVAANERFDPATNAWTTRKPMPVARAAMASGTLNGHIQVWGGEGPSGTPTSTYGHGHDFDPRTNTWITIADQPTPRHGTDGVTIGSHVHVAGGGPQAGASVTDVHEAFAFVSDAGPVSCIPSGSNPATTDSDGDQYTNQDEADNGTNPCSAASVPPDNDLDRISDRNDPDDDNDTVADTADQFQYDPANGTATTLPWIQNWNPGDPPAGEYANTGFPGVQLASNGGGYIDGRVHAGGAGGYMTIDATGGTHRANVDTQDDALQVGFDARSPVTITARLADPFSGQTIESGKQGGIFFGLDEDNYVSLAVATNAGAGQPGLAFAVETGGIHVANPQGPPAGLAMPGPSRVDLQLTLDPSAKGITARYRVDSTDPAAFVTIGTVDATSYPALATFFKLGAAAGVATTKGSAVSSFGLAYDFFAIEPAAGPAPVSVNTASLPPAAVGQAYSVTLQAGGGTPPYTWSLAAGALPPGLALSASTGVISGTPTTAATTSFTVRATDSGTPGQSATRALSIEVKPALFIQTSSLPAATASQPYSATLQATGGSPPYTWAIASGSLPAGLALNASTGTIAGTPTTAGTATFTVRATDAGPPVQSVTKSLSITVGPAPLSITTSSLPGGSVGSAYSATLQASGGVTPRTWSLASGTRPAGLTLTGSTGVISGTPSATGTSSFTVRVTDSGSPQQVATRTLSIAVTVAPLQITTASLPGGRVNIPYSVTLQGSGGVQPYRWTIVSGALPPGLTLNATSGTISGTPTRQGNVTFTVRLTDAASPAASVDRTYGLKVTKR